MTHERHIFGSPPSPMQGMTLPPHAIPQHIVISHAGFRDLTKVARLQRRAFRPPLAYGLTTLFILWALPHVRFLIARQGDMICGCAIGDRQGGQARVINLCVDPDTRRRGIGGRLLGDLEHELPGGDVVLMVEQGNTAAQALYRRDGYTPVGTGYNYYGRGQHGIWMQKKRTTDPSPKLRV